MPQLTQALIDRAVPPLPSASIPAGPIPPSPIPPSPIPPGPIRSGPDETRLRAEMTVFLHDRDPKLGLWIFAYGTLMWEHAGAAPDIVTPARLPGLARRYTLRDALDRGTPAAPGLSLGLEAAPALACPGLLLHLPGPKVADRLWPIWRHEMGPGLREAGWREATMHASRDPGGAPVRALCLTPRRTHPAYLGELPVGTVADTLARASGRNGSAAAALLRAAETLRSHGMRDAYLESLEAEVARRLAAAPGQPPGT